MRVVVDWDLCEANAKCEEIAPEMFEVQDDEKSHVLLERPGEELREKAERAVRMCPKTAISIEEA
jgi:ferredoxin